MIEIGGVDVVVIRVVSVGQEQMSVVHLYKIMGVARRWEVDFKWEEGSCNKSVLKGCFVSVAASVRYILLKTT